MVMMSASKKTTMLIVRGGVLMQGLTNALANVSPTGTPSAQVQDLALPENFTMGDLMIECLDFFLKKRNYSDYQRAITENKVDLKGMPLEAIVPLYEMCMMVKGASSEGWAVAKDALKGVFKDIDLDVLDAADTKGSSIGSVKSGKDFARFAGVMSKFIGNVDPTKIALSPCGDGRPNKMLSALESKLEDASKDLSPFDMLAEIRAGLLKEKAAAAGRRSIAGSMSSESKSQVTQSSTLRGSGRSARQQKSSLSATKQSMTAKQTLAKSTPVWNRAPASLAATKC